MRRRAGEIRQTAIATSWADVAAHVDGGTRSCREEVEEGEEGRVHTEREEREPERESDIHVDEEKSRHPGGQGLRHIPGQEETGRNDTMEAVTPQSLAPTHAAEIQIEWEGVGQEKGTDETRYRTPITQKHVQHEGNNQMWRKRGVVMNRWKRRYVSRWTPQLQR